MQREEVRAYYDLLVQKSWQLRFKRLFDVFASSMLLVLLAGPFVLIAIAIKVDSPGPVFFRQERVTQFGREFRIFKFRTMSVSSENAGRLITTEDDSRITRFGTLMRRLRIDELSQLIDVFRGTMSLVGPRPEVPKYVEAYGPEMLATLLVPAGVTSTASICFKDEAEMLVGTDDPERKYLEEILPAKLQIALEDVRHVSVVRDVRILLRTVGAVAGTGGRR